MAARRLDRHPAPGDAPETPLQPRYVGCDGLSYVIGNGSAVVVKMD
jgi:hypothetical protein